MQYLTELLTNQPVPWHPALRVAALDAALIKMCSHAIDSVGQFHDVVVNDFGKYGVSPDVICTYTKPDVNATPKGDHYSIDLDSTSL